MRADDPRHGTIAGVSEHQRLGFPVCGSCRRAKMRYEKARHLGITGNKVLAIGAQRRVGALRTAGWTTAEIARTAGYVGASSIKYLFDATTITRSTAAKIAAAYDELCDREPTAFHANRARTWAAKSSDFPPPSAWFGVDIDDPDAQPDPGWSDWPNGKKPMAATLEDFDWLVDQGESPERAAERLGVDVKTIADYRRRAAKQVAA